MGQLLVAAAEEPRHAMLDHLPPTPGVLSNDGDADGHCLQSGAGPVLARSAVDREQAVELAEEVLRWQRHRLQAIRPRRRLAELLVGALVHPEHKRPTAAVLDAPVD